MSSNLKLVLAVVITATLTCISVLVFLSNNPELLLTPEVPVQTVVPTPRPSVPARSSLEQEVRIGGTTLAPKFDSMDQYVSLITNSSTQATYEASLPSGYDLVRFGSASEPVDVSPDGISVTVQVLAQPGWDSGTFDDIQTFYLKAIGRSPCWMDEVCTLPNTETYYGPFQGNLKLLVQ